MTIEYTWHLHIVYIFQIWNIVFRTFPVSLFDITQFRHAWCFLQVEPLLVYSLTKNLHLRYSKLIHSWWMVTNDGPVLCALRSYVCIYSCLHVHIHIHTCIYMYIYMHMYVKIHIYTCTYICMCMHVLRDHSKHQLLPSVPVFEILGQKLVVLKVTTYSYTEHWPCWGYLLWHCDLQRDPAWNIFVGMGYFRNSVLMWHLLRWHLMQQMWITETPDSPIASHWIWFILPLSPVLSQRLSSKESVSSETDAANASCHVCERQRVHVYDRQWEKEGQIKRSFGGTKAWGRGLNQALRELGGTSTASQPRLIRRSRSLVSLWRRSPAISVGAALESLYDQSVIFV